LSFFGSLLKKSNYLMIHGHPFNDLVGLTPN